MHNTINTSKPGPRSTRFEFFYLIETGARPWQVANEVFDCVVHHVAETDRGSGPAPETPGTAKQIFLGAGSSVSIAEGLSCRGSATAGDRRRPTRRFAADPASLCGGFEQSRAASGATAGSIAGAGASCSMSRRLICASIRMSSRKGEGFERLCSTVLSVSRWRARVHGHIK